MPTKVQTCLVIDAPDAGQALRRARVALRGSADLVEIRLDRLRGLSGDTVDRIGAALGARAVATLRSRRQGGGWSGRRSSLLLRAATAGFGLIDVEVTTDARDLAALRTAARRAGAEVIASHHFLRPEPPGRVAAMVDRCCRAGDIGKVAVVTDRLAAALRLVRIGAALPASRRFVLVGMGARGAITRALAHEMGCALEYVRPDRGPAAAPGQLSISEWGRLRGGGRGRLLGLVGRPVGHSVSAPMQNAALRAADAPGIYLPLEAIGRADLEALLATPGLGGFNVTMPHKERIVPLLDALDPEARRLGAVNTVRIRGGAARGYNTDGHGFRKMLEAVRRRRAGRALVIGAGGAARAVVDVLAGGAADEIVIASRRPARARALARRQRRPARCETAPLEDIADAGPFDLVVHCTPIGTAGGPRGEIVPESLLREGVTVLDLVYNPSVTPLLERARRRGARTSGGLEMLVQQGARSFEIWTGRPAPLRAMRAAARAAVREMAPRRKGQG